MRMTGTRPRSSSSRPPWSPPMTAGAERGAPVLVMTVIRAGGPWFSANVCDPQGGIPRPARTWSPSRRTSSSTPAATSTSATRTTGCTSSPCQDFDEGSRGARIASLRRSCPWVVGFCRRRVTQCPVRESENVGKVLSSDGDRGRGHLIEQAVDGDLRGRRRRRLCRGGVVAVQYVGQRGSRRRSGLSGRRCCAAAARAEVREKFVPRAAPQGEDGERVVVEGLGEQIQGGGEVFAGDLVIRAAAVQGQVADAGREEGEPCGGERVLDVRGHLAGQELRRVPGVVGERFFDAGPVGLPEGGEPDAYPVRPGAAALDQGDRGTGLDVELDHLPGAGVALAARESPTRADRLQPLDEPCRPPVLPDLPAAAAGP